MIRYVILAMMLVSFASAQGIFYEDRAERFEAGKEYAICKANFNIQVMESHMEELGVDLHDEVDELEGDIEEIQNLDMENGFWPYMNSQFRPHMMHAREMTIQTRAGMMQGHRMNLINEYSDHAAEYRECIASSLEKYGNAKVSAYEHMLDRAESRADELESKDLDVSELRNLISQAQSDIVDVLKGDLKNAETGEQIRNAIRSTCMYDGCPNGMNFHFSAKWHIAKMESIVDLYGDDVDFSEASGYLDEAEDILDSSGNGFLNDGELWRNIRAASNSIKEALFDLRSSDE